MSSPAVWQIESQQPTVRVAPRARDSYGPDAGFLCSSYGLTPDPWQQLVLDDWLARKGGQWASLTIGLAVPRQNGKNGIIEMREVFGMVGRGEKILHTAHEVKTAQKAFKRLKHFFGNEKNDPGAKFPELNALVEDVRNTNGQEGIFLKNGGSVEIVARSKNSGRGFTVDTLIFDEAQEMDEEDLEALLPTTSAAPKRDPQWIYTGTPPGPKASGAVFTDKRAEALGGKSHRLAWHEWSVSGEVDLDDRRLWYLTNPAMGRRLSIDVAAGERTNLSDDGFARERLGAWEEASSSHVINPDDWARCADAASLPASRFVLAIDVDPEQARGSVAFAGLRADGLVHVELDEQRQGTGWIAAYVADRCARNNIAAVVVDERSPAAALLDELKRRKVRRLVTTRSGDMASACAQFYQATVEGQLRHTDQPQLTSALMVARKRPLEDRWAWNRKSADADITPVVAATLAAWGAQTTKVRGGTAEGDKRGRRVVTW